MKRLRLKNIRRWVKMNKSNCFKQVLIFQLLRISYVPGTVLGTGMHACVFSCVWLWDPTKLPCPWNFPSKNTGAGCHFLLQGIFLTQQSLAPPALAGRFFTTAPPGKPKHWDMKVNETLCASISSWAHKGKIILYGINSTIETCRWYSVEEGHELRLRLAERLLDIELILYCFPNHITECLT